MTNEETNTFITHYGIKGQRWGVRRKRNPKTGRVESDDSKTARALSKKHLSEMSNKELAELNKRLNLERSYRNLTKTEKSKGRKIVEDVVAEVGKDLAKRILKDATESALKEAMKKRKKKP